MLNLTPRCPGLGPEVLELGQLDVCFFSFYSGLDWGLLTVSPVGERGGGVSIVFCCLSVASRESLKEVTQVNGRCGQWNGSWSIACMKHSNEGAGTRLWDVLQMSMNDVG